MLGEVRAFRRSEWREEGRLGVCQPGDLEVDAARGGAPLMARQPSSRVVQDKTAGVLPTSPSVPGVKGQLKSSQLALYRVLC